MANVFGSRSRFEEFKDQAKQSLDAATDEDGQVDIPGTTTKRVLVRSHHEDERMIAWPYLCDVAAEAVQRVTRGSGANVRLGKVPDATVRVLFRILPLHASCSSRL